MSFIFSRALVEAFSEANYLVTDASAQSNGNPTPKPSLWHDKTMEVSRHSRFGMTCEPLTGYRGAELLTWWLADSLARTSALPERAQASPESVRDSGPTWRASLAKFDPASCSWKTVQLSLLGDSELSSVTWPRSGMTANGQCWELPTLERRTIEIGSGFWPTPVSSDTSSRKKPYAQGGTPLSLAVKLWPTPTVCGNYNRKGASKTSGDGLATAVRMWRTPNASDANKWSNQSLAERMEKGQQIRLNTQVAPEGGAGGMLNPNWVEWLMGWPIGWTDLKPLETDKFQHVQQPHGESLEGLEA